MKAKPEKDKFTPEEREALGIWAHRASVAIKEREQAAGKTVSEQDLAPWKDLSEADKEVYRLSGEDMSGGATCREQMMWAGIERQRALMGEKAFRENVYSICVSIAVEGIAQQVPEHERQRTVDAIVKMAVMLDVPNDAERKSRT